MADRSTSDSIRLAYDILKYAYNNKKPGILLMIDFEKAFDSIAWSFLEKALSFFNFGPSICKWIKLFVTDIRSCVIVNGMPSSWFNLERGCRQGDPISPYLFLLCAEILAHMIRQNDNIKGFFISELETKITQFADDTYLFLDGSKESFEYCVHTILEYAKYSGLNMNYNKTKVVWFGNDKIPKTTFLPHLNFEWNPKTFTILGVEFTVDLKNITDLNITKKMNSMKQEMQLWSKRYLTPFGKIIVIKSLVVSKIVHILQSLPSPSENIFKELEKMFYGFLWNNGPDKIKRLVSTQSKFYGGIDMLNIRLFDKSLKISWIGKLFRRNSKWGSVIKQMCPHIANMRENGPEYIDCLMKTKHNKFWTDTLASYKFFTQKYTITNWQAYISQSFLFNQNIKIDNRPIRYDIFSKNGIFLIHHLKSGKNFMHFQEFTQAYPNSNINFMIFNSVISALRRYESKLSINYDNVGCLENQTTIQFLINIKKGSSKIHRVLKENTNIPSGVRKWQGEHDIMNRWTDAFTLLIKTTPDTKLIWLQFRILHHCLTTNRSVSKFKPEQTDLCEFCRKKSESIIHLLWQCPYIQQFWTSLAEYINIKCTHVHNFHFTKDLVLFGMCHNIKTDTILDLIILLAKQYIYSCKVKTTLPSFATFKYIINERYKIEKTLNANSADGRWIPYKNMFLSLHLTPP